MAGVTLTLDRFRLAAHSYIRRMEMDCPFDSYSTFFNNLLAPFDLNVHTKNSSPSIIASQLCHDNCHQNIKELHGDTFGIWHAVALGIRASDPNYKASQRNHQVEKNWNKESLSMVQKKDTSSSDVDSALTYRKRNYRQPTPE